MLDWLRRWLGESEDMREARAQLADAATREASLGDSVTALRRNLRDMLEPAGGDCRKVRLRSQAEAEEFADRVARDTGGGPFSWYKCKVCPRQPGSLDRFFHITHGDRAKRGRTYQPRTGPGALQFHASPEDVAHLLNLKRQMVANGGE